MLAQLPSGQRLPDRGIGKGLAGAADYTGTVLQASGRQGDIGRDHDVPSSGIIGDPVVRLVESSTDYDQPDTVMKRNPERAVGNQRHVETVALGNPVNFILHRTGV